MMICLGFGVVCGGLWCLVPPNTSLLLLTNYCINTNILKSLFFTWLYMKCMHFAQTLLFTKHLINNSQMHLTDRIEM